MENSYRTSVPVTWAFKELLEVSIKSLLIILILCLVTSLCSACTDEQDLFRGIKLGMTMKEVQAIETQYGSTPIEDNSRQFSPYLKYKTKDYQGIGSRVAAHVSYYFLQNCDKNEEYTLRNVYLELDFWGENSSPLVKRVINDLRDKYEEPTKTDREALGCIVSADIKIWEMPSKKVEFKHQYFFFSRNTESYYNKNSDPQSITVQYSDHNFDKDYRIYWGCSQSVKGCCPP